MHPAGRGAASETPEAEAGIHQRVGAKALRSPNLNLLSRPDGRCQEQPDEQAKNRFGKGNQKAGKGKACPGIGILAGYH